MNIDTLVIKTASRCNLNCSYCYVYNMGDETYKVQPKLMSEDTALSIVKRTEEHCIENKVQHFSFVFHGGEPLLQSKSFYSFFVQHVNELLIKKHSIKCYFSLQTNGLLMDKEWCLLLNKLKISTGISLDGYKEINDQFRVDHKGRGSYDKTIRGINIGKQYLKRKVGILGVMDINSDPVKMYDHIKRTSSNSIMDMLWPLATWDNYPKELVVDSCDSQVSTPFADWLITIFDLWFEERPKTNLQIRIFTSIMNLIMDVETGWDEEFGLNNNKLLCIETDGNMGVSGDFNICGKDFFKPGSNIHSHSFTNSLQTPLGEKYYEGSKNLCQQCTHCPIVEVCGGGHMTSRYSNANGFNNPSIYCHDRIKLIVHIQNAIFDALPEKYKEKFNRMNYLEVRRSILKNKQVEMR